MFDESREDLNKIQIFLKDKLDLYIVKKCIKILLECDLSITFWFR